MTSSAPAGFFPGVGKLGGLGLSSPSRVHKRSPDGVWGEAKLPEADDCFKNNA